MWRSRIKNLAIWAVGGLTLIVEGPAIAWDGAVSGTISAIEVTNGTNQGFRVFLNGVTTMCSGGVSWAYINDTDSNYKTYAATLMMAKAQGSTVTIYTTLESGYCHVGYISIV